MKTQITVETTDQQRYVIGTYVTGEPHKASREEVATYFEPMIRIRLNLLDRVARQQRDAVLEGLDMDKQEPLADDES